MSLRINDQAPNFQAETTQGKIDFHKWIGDSWAVLFSHPKDFKVCSYCGNINSHKNKFCWVCHLKKILHRSVLPNWAIWPKFSRSLKSEIPKSSG